MDRNKTYISGKRHLGTKHTNLMFDSLSRTVTCTYEGVDLDICLLLPSQGDVFNTPLSELRTSISTR